MPRRFEKLGEGFQRSVGRKSVREKSELRIGIPPFGRAPKSLPHERTCALEFEEAAHIRSRLLRITSRAIPGASLRLAC